MPCLHRRILSCLLLVGVGLSGAVRAAETVPGPVTTVGRAGGVPTFFVDGEPYTRPIFETYVPQAKYFRQFAEAGCEVHMFSINLGQALACTHVARPIWVEPDRFDFTQMDARVREVLAADPDGYILPRFFIGAPDWWVAAHVDQCLVLDTGLNYYVSPAGNAVTTNRLFPSLASQVWRDDMSRGIKTVIEHILQSDYADRLFGVQITGLYTEEWYHWSSNANQLADYSAPFREGFARWLRQKYGDVDALRRAWSDPEVDFETVRVPGKAHRVKGQHQLTFRDPLTDMAVIDYYLYYNDVMPETIEVFCRAAKEACQGRKVVGAFYGFMFEFGGNPEFGHKALNRFLASPDIDFMVVTASYHNRLVGAGADYTRSAATSVQLHDKVWYHDNDTLSFLYMDVLLGSQMHVDAGKREEAEAMADHIGAPRTLAETLAQYRRTAGFCLAWGMQPSFFDLHGGYFDHPTLMAEVARLTEILAASARHDRRSVAEILVVSDEPSCSYATYQSELLGQVLDQTQPALCKIGAPYDSILIDDLDRVDMDRYRLVVFLNTFHLTDSQRRQIDERVKGAGRVLLWCYAPGLFNGALQSVAGMEALTGLRILPAADEFLITPRVKFRSSGAGLASALLAAGLTETGATRPGGKLFYVEDATAATVGVLPGTDKTTMAVKDMGDWTSVYAITAQLAPGVYRALARQAGVHLYNDRDDSFYVNRSYITLNADGAGVRTIVLPGRADVYDLLDGGGPVHRDVTRFEIDLADRDTALFRYQLR